MATRVYLLPGAVLLLCAFILSLLVTISLPKLPSLHIVRTSITDIYPDGTPFGYSTVVKVSLFFLTLTTLLILFLHIVSIGSMVSGKKGSAVRLLIELTF